MKTNCTFILKTEKNTSFFFKIYRGGQFFLWGTNTPVFGLLMTCALGFKARVDPLAHVLCHLVHNGILRFTSGATTPADSLWLAWQPSHSHPLICKQALVGLETRIWKKDLHVRQRMMFHTKTVRRSRPPSLSAR